MRLKVVHLLSCKIGALYNFLCIESFLHFASLFLFCAHRPDICQFSVCLAVCLYICLSLYWFVCIFVCLFVCLSVCLFVCLSVCLYIYLSVLLFVAFFFLFSISCEFQCENCHAAGSASCLSVLILRKLQLALGRPPQQHTDYGKYIKI